MLSVSILNASRKVEIMRYPAGKYSDYPVVLNIELADDYKGWDVSTFTPQSVFFQEQAF